MERAYYPRYVSVYDALLKDIQNGIYKPGERLPGENELAKKFDVSRNTLRQAILLLHEDGYVSNHQGKGTFVLKTHNTKKLSIENAVNPLLSFPISQVTEVKTAFEIRQISPKNQKIFNLDSSNLLILLKNIYHSNETPIGCSLALVPYNTFAEAKVPLDDERAVSEFYDSLLNDSEFQGESILRVTTPRDPVDKMLGVTSSETLLMLDEVVRDRKDQIVMTQKLFLLPSYYELSIIRHTDRADAKKRS